jgi:hypothetical protein
MSIFSGLLAEGRLLALATTGPQRARALPNTPTLRELGQPVEAEAFWGTLAPAGTPVPIRERFAAALTKALAVPEVNQRLTGTLGVDVAPRLPRSAASRNSGRCIASKYPSRELGALQLLLGRFKMAVISDPFPGQSH